MSIDERVHRIVRAVPGDAFVHFGVIRKAPPVQKRVESAADVDALIEIAQTLRRTDGIHFWDALFLSGERLEHGVPDDILEAALYHQGIELLDQGRVRSSTAPGAAASLEAQLDPGEMLVLTSKLDLETDTIAHIPMLDFSTRVGQLGAEITVRRAVRALGLDGSLLMSGRSYHFYGHRLLRESEHRAFLASALLLAPIVDGRWVAHQLLSGFTSLRISAGDKGNIPEWVGDVR